MAYLPLSTANLPDPAIDPAQGSSPQDYFNTVLYTGTGAAQDIDVGFQPDFTWIKARGLTYSHNLVDAVRGSTKRLESDTTDAEADAATSVTSFNSDGFSLGSRVLVNADTAPFVAWNWKANGSGVSNTDGSITSTVSANTESGFSIVSYTGNGTAGATIGHGLTSAPDMIIVKNRDNGGMPWLVYHSSNTSAPETDYLLLNSTSATTDFNTAWNDTAPTSSVFSVGTADGTNQNANDIIAYCFHSVEGFSKFGSYTGNGNADGTFVYTGFRPAFILIKSSTVSGSAWYLFDEERNIYNPLTFDLYANYSNAESGSSSGRLDMLSNGFKMRSTSADTNSNGATMIYMAFAENPFKYSNAR
jgi:hypothetical protein